jgi:cation diffusion facilitator family transporter
MPSGDPSGILRHANPIPVEGEHSSIMEAIIPGEQDGVLKEKTARLSVASNTLLVVAKLAVGFAIGSVGIISEAIHSAIDLIAAVIAYFSVRQSARPPDECHTFGHGKYESISGLLEAVLILAAAVLIINEAVRNLLGGEGTLNVEGLGLGIAVMLLSAGVNIYVSSRLMTVAKKTESIALESDAWHLRTDVYTSAGVVVGLVLIRLTGLVVLDALIALVVAAIILRAAFDLIRRSFEDLVDRSLPADEEARIREIISGYCTDVIDFHRLRTRRSGPNRFVDLHMVVPRTATLEEAYGIVKQVEDDIRREFPRANVTIRVQPCTGEDCASCGVFTTCPECDRLALCGRSKKEE